MKTPSPDPARPLAGQTALVTGGSRGIGRGIAERMAAAGASVAVNFRSDRDSAEEVVTEITKDGGQAMTVQADISDEQAVRQMFSQVRDHFGAVHCLVANAGVEANAPIHDMSLEDWDKVLSVDLTGTFLCLREAVREFRSFQIPDAPARLRGTVIAITSVHDRIPFGEHANYCAAKAGARMLIKNAALEYGKDRMRFNAIAPGAIATDINREVWDDPESRQELMKVIPFNEIGAAADIGEAATWLASDAASYITGSTLVIDGGMQCYPSFLDNG